MGDASTSTKDGVTSPTNTVKAIGMVEGEFLPCPCCENQNIYYHSKFINEQLLWKVSCGNPEKLCSVQTGYYINKESCSYVWNNRLSQFINWELIRAMEKIAAPIASCPDDEDKIPSYTQVIDDYTKRVAIARKALSTAKPPAYTKDELVALLEPYGIEDRYGECNGLLTPQEAITTLISAGVLRVKL